MKRSRDEWGAWVRGRLAMADVGPFSWSRIAEAGNVEHTASIARDPGVEMTTGYVGRFLWSVTWPSEPGAPKRVRGGATSSLILAEQAIAGAVELGPPAVLFYRLLDDRTGQQLEPRELEGEA